MDTKQFSQNTSDLFIITSVMEALVNLKILSSNIADDLYWNIVLSPESSINDLDIKIAQLRLI